MGTYATVKSLRSIYQLKITLRGIRPPIWRRLLVASTVNLEDVHVILQIVMGWTDSHMHEFAKGSDRYGVPDEDFPSDSHDETNYRLDQILKEEKGKLIYTYDFGDSWSHEVVLEKILPFETGTVLPMCLKGSRACPPEDIGGIMGYAMFLDAISDPAHPEHKSMQEWIGEDLEGNFDSEYFDLVQVNDRLKGMNENSIGI
ncbi:plasmid pRiA4b ORF-3 family protein [Nitrosomonas sp.]|uniref:plasmid pRiA4b ORF-3 family protein n=1 Tax=Nitrosomonas sp. TaxID=42353 RepID=UPI00263253EA|nr:plasmid pRiA4b ORF-3 family protein [Nitrosomonas sp.]